MRVTFLGTGTSVGVPAVGCDCHTCLSTDPRDKRLRTSVLIEQGEIKIIIDASIDFRQQALAVRLKRLDAILFTLKPRRALLTHISHDIKHEETSRALPSNVEIAYDGLKVDVD